MYAAQRQSVKKIRSQPLSKIEEFFTIKQHVISLKMPIITGISRHKITFTDLENRIAKNNEIRFINAFVDNLDLKQLGIQDLIQTQKKKKVEYSHHDGLQHKTHQKHLRLRTTDVVLQELGTNTSAPIIITNFL